MTDKEHEQFWQVVTLLAVLISGLAIGSLVTASRYESEIRTDQLELKEQFAEIREDRAVIDDITDELLSQVEKIKAERKSLEELKIRLIEGEMK